MRNESQATIPGAQHAQIRVVTLDTAGAAVAEALAAECRRDPAADVSIRRDEAPLDADAGVATWAAADDWAAVLILASTQSAAGVATVVSALAQLPVASRRRVWPAFVAGGVAGIATFEERLAELAPGAVDAVLLLPDAPCPDEAADAIHAWLTVKVPAPPSVLGQLADADGHVCRYVAIGVSEAEAVASPTAATAATAATASPGSDADADGPSSIDADSIVTSSEFGLQLGAARDAIGLAAAAGDAGAALAAEHALVAASGADVGAQLAAELAPHLGDAAADLPGEVSVRAMIDSGPLTAAASEFVMLASRSGLGRWASRSRRVSAAERLNAAATDLVAATCAEWAARAGDLVQACTERAAARRAVEQSERDAAAASTRREEAIAAALRAGRPWIPDASPVVQRAWGAGTPPLRRYLIGNPETVGPVVDVTDGSNPCLVVTTGAGDDRVRVLTAQYGLPLSVLLPAEPTSQAPTDR